MAITDKVRKMLWGLSGSRCAYCRCPLVMPATKTDKPAVVGDECHIVAKSEQGPRGEQLLGEEERDGYDNLILLCNVHHTLVDEQPLTYTPQVLRELKSQHEAWVQQALQFVSSQTTQKRRFQIALTFCGKSARPVAEKIASALAQQGYHVFYDRWYEHEMLGANGADYLGRIYSTESQFCLALLDSDYDKSTWTTLEREIIQSRSLAEGPEVLLPVMLTDYRPGWLPRTRIFYDYAARGHEGLLDLLIKKLGAAQIHTRGDQLPKLVPLALVATSAITKFKTIPERILRTIGEIPGISPSGQAEVQNILSFIGGPNGPNSQISYCFSESPFSVNEAELLGIPELAVSVRLKLRRKSNSGETLDVVNLRRMEYLEAPPESVKRAKRKSAGFQSPQFRDRLLYAPTISECIIAPPDRLESWGDHRWHWNVLPKEAVTAYGEKDQNQSTLYYKPIAPAGCAHACCLMATAMLYNYAQKIPSLRDVCATGIHPNVLSEGRFNPNGMTLNDVLSFFTNNGLGLTAHVEREPLAYTNLQLKRKDPFEAIRSYVVSGFPVILLVDLGRMAGRGQSSGDSVYCRNGFMAREMGKLEQEPHTVLVVGVHSRRDYLAFHDPACLPYMVMSADDIQKVALSDFGAGASGIAPVMFIPVLPRRVKLPIFSSPKTLGLDAVSRVMRFTTNLIDPSHEAQDVVVTPQRQLVRRQNLEALSLAVTQVDSDKHDSFVAELSQALRKADVAEDQWLWVEAFAGSSFLLWNAEQPIERLPETRKGFIENLSSHLLAWGSVPRAEITIIKN